MHTSLVVSEAASCTVRSFPEAKTWARDNCELLVSTFAVIFSSESLVFLHSRTNSDFKFLVTDTFLVLTVEEYQVAVNTAHLISSSKAAEPSSASDGDAMPSMPSANDGG
jgi:hypothetical protein